MLNTWSESHKIFTFIKKVFIKLQTFPDHTLSPITPSSPKRPGNPNEPYTKQYFHVSESCFKCYLQNEWPFFISV